MFVAVKDTKSADGQVRHQFRTEDAARVGRIFDRLAISEHPDVATHQSEIIRSKEEKDPTKARKDSPSPSAHTSPGRGGSANNSVRDQLRVLRNERAATAPIKPPKGRQKAR
jgi:hypothetical protein